MPKKYCVSVFGQQNTSSRNLNFITAVTLQLWYSYFFLCCCRVLHRSFNITYFFEWNSINGLVIIDIYYSKYCLCVKDNFKNKNSIKTTIKCCNLYFVKVSRLKNGMHKSIWLYIIVLINAKSMTDMMLKTISIS